MLKLEKDLVGIHYLHSLRNFHHKLLINYEGEKVTL